MGVMPYIAILAELTSDDVLDTAHDWQYKRRRDYPPDADIWSFRHRWREEKAIIKTALLKGTYRFDLPTQSRCSRAKPFVIRHATVLRRQDKARRSGEPSRGARQRQRIRNSSVSQPLNAAGPIRA